MFISLVMFLFASIRGTSNISQATSTSNMSRIQNDNFSPFYKAKKLILALRWLLGFPLKPTNEAFNQFAFQPFLECPRLVLALSIPVVCFGYINYIAMKQLNIWNPLEAFQQYTNSVGISGLDFVVIMLLPLQSWILSIAYFFSFKNAHVGLNKILWFLTKINEEIYDMNRGMQFFYETPFWRFIFILVIFVMAIGMYTFCWVSILLADSSTTMEAIILYFAAALMSISNIYPFMSISADSVVVQLVNETSNAFESFRLTMKSAYKCHRERRRTKVSGPSCKDKNQILPIPR